VPINPPASLGGGRQARFFAARRIDRHSNATHFGAGRPHLPGQQINFQDVISITRIAPAAAYVRRTSTGVATMTGVFSTRKGLALTVALIVAGCAAATLADWSTGSAALTTPIGMAEWQCSKTMGVLTVCTKKPHASPASNCPQPSRASLRPT
jgi:hypothetical protein